jgi:hypothetical protein
MNALRMIGSWLTMFAVGCLTFIVIGALSRFYWELLMLGWRWGVPAS